MDTRTKTCPSGAQDSAQVDDQWKQRVTEHLPMVTRDALGGLMSCRAGPLPPRSPLRPARFRDPL